jgi:uncharacterized membrane protein YgcG
VEAQTVTHEKICSNANTTVLRDKRMVLHAHNEKDLESKVEDMTQADGRRLRADESEVVEFIVIDEQTVL